MLNHQNFWHTWYNVEPSVSSGINELIKGIKFWTKRCKCTWHELYHFSIQILSLYRLLLHTVMLSHIQKCLVPTTHFNFLKQQISNGHRTKSSYCELCTRSSCFLGTCITLVIRIGLADNELTTETKVLKLWHDQDLFFHCWEPVWNRHGYWEVLITPVSTREPVWQHENIKWSYTGPIFYTGFSQFYTGLYRYSGSHTASYTGPLFCRLYMYSGSHTASYTGPLFCRLYMYSNSSNRNCSNLYFGQHNLYIIKTWILDSNMFTLHFRA
jgi:hypothetical protein